MELFLENFTCICAPISIFLIRGLFLLKFTVDLSYSMYDCLVPDSINVQAAVTKAMLF